MNGNGVSRSAACALAALMLAAASTTAIDAAQAQQVNQRQYRFDIAAKPVPQALNEIGRVTGLSVVFPEKTPITATGKSVRGSMTAARALSILLAGTGLDYRFSNATTVTIRAPDGSTSAGNADGATQLAPITVQGAGQYPSDPYAGLVNPPSTVGSKIPLTQREIPQTVAVMTQREIKERNIQSLDQAMKATPGITVLQSDADRVQYYSRGFPINSMVVDGLPVVTNSDMSATASTNAPNLAMYDRIEVLDGPAGLYGGFGSAGGVISLVRKRAPDHFSASFDATAGTKDNLLGALDVGGPLNADASLRGRFVVSGQTRDLDQRSTWHRDQSYYGTVEADITDDTLLRLGASYSRRDSNVGWANQIPLYSDFTVAGDRSDFYGTPWNRDRYAETNTFASIEHSFENGWKLTATGTYDYKTARVLSGEIFGMVDKATNEATFGTTNTDYFEHNQSYDLNATGKYELFGRDHDLAIGVNYARMYNFGTSYYGTDSLFNFETIDIANYAFAKPTWSGLPATTSKGATEINQTGIYGSTRFHITDDLTAIGGGRLSWWDTAFRPDANYNPFGNSENGDRYNAKFTPYAGLVYDIDRTYSVYGSFASIFQPQSFRDVSGALLKPMEGEQYEIGLKGSYLDGQLQTTIALFQLTQSNRAVATDATNQYFMAAGRARSRGIDLRVSGEIAADWTVMAGYTYTNSKYLDEDSLDTSASAFSQIAPKHLFKLWTNYQLPGEYDQWQIGAGINATSELYGGSGSESITQKAFLTADARVAYKVNDNVSLTLNATNIFDKKYFTPLTTYQGVAFGEGRRVSLTLHSKF